MPPPTLDTMTHESTLLKQLNGFKLKRQNYVYLHEMCSFNYLLLLNPKLEELSTGACFFGGFRASRRLANRMLGLNWFFRFSAALTSGQRFL